MSEIVRFNDKQEFFGIIEPLEQLFSTLSDKQRDIYYEALRGKDGEIFSLAVEWLLREHGYRRFPLIKEIKQAIEVVVSTRLKRETEGFNGMKKESDCYSCNSTGYVLFEKNGRTTARYCGCPIGKHLQGTVVWGK